MAYGLGFFIAILCQEPIYGFGDPKTPHGPSFLVLGKGYEAVPVMERTVTHPNYLNDVYKRKWAVGS